MLVFPIDFRARLKKIYRAVLAVLIGAGRRPLRYIFRWKLLPARQKDESGRNKYGSLSSQPGRRNAFRPYPAGAVQKVTPYGAQLRRNFQRTQ